MTIVRRLLLVILSPLFAFLLLATAFDVGVMNTAGHPEKVKQLLNDSGLYDSIVPSLLQQQASVNTSLGDFSTSDPLVRQAVEQAVPASEVKSQVDSAIDNIYQWLNGQIRQPDFKINLSTSQEKFADNISSIVRQRLSKLPACSTAESLSLAEEGRVDITRLTCLPPGLTADNLAGQIKRIMLGSNFLSSVNISASSLKDASGHPIFTSAAAHQVPQRYRQAKRLPSALITLSVLCGLAIIFLSRTRRGGLRHVGSTLLFTGVIMLLAAWAIQRADSSIAQKLQLGSLQTVEQAIHRLISQLAILTSHNYLLFGAAYATLGLLLVVVSLTRRRPDAASELGNQPQIPSGK